MPFQKPLLKNRAILDFFKEHIVVFDGAMGTQIQSFQLSSRDFGGHDYEGCNEYLNITAPHLIQIIHENYLKAGAHVIETNSFGSTPLVLSEYGLENSAFDISKKSAEIARLAVQKIGGTRFVAGSMGPTTKSISVTGGIDFDTLKNHYLTQALGLLDGGVDFLLIETAQDTMNVKAAFLGISQAFFKYGYSVPLMLSATIETMGSMLAGQNVEALATAVEHMDLLSIGLNCATGPDFMTDHVRTLNRLSPCLISCMPNAGLPDEEGHYHESPIHLADKLAQFAESGLVHIVGGCCGTTPAHIREIAKCVKDIKPRKNKTSIVAAVSGIDYLPFTDYRPCIVGERTNVIGSKKFKELIVAEAFEEAAEIARKQMKNGAHILDVCLANPDRDELKDMDLFLRALTKQVFAPLMIDSTDAAVIETALKHCQGKAIINSINLEEGEERFKQIVPLIKQYGAAVVVGCIDEDKHQGMAVTKERKLAIAQRSYHLLTEQYGVAAHNIIFDPLVFPAGSGDANYHGSAKETIAGVKLIKQEFPHCFTILGISNVSFGLPNQGREILNNVFLHMALEAGLDFALVNSEKLVRITHIKPQEIELCKNLIHYQGLDPIGQFAQYFKSKKTENKNTTLDFLNVNERLSKRIVDGSKDGLTSDLNEALKDKKPLDIINGPLMQGMSEVGKLFNDNQLIVAEVLQSAEVMKAAVAYLEPYMEKTDTKHRGKMILATVKGDVHDIGKNLVDIILSNNGYQIINLGIKVPAADIVEAIRVHQPDMIGLSGLLVKSAHEMVNTAKDLSQNNIETPLLVGGAALSARFTYSKIGPQYQGPVIYAKDAMMGLEIANQLMNKDKKPQLLAQLEQEKSKTAQMLKEKEQIAPIPNSSEERIHIVYNEQDKVKAPDYKLHVEPDFALDQVFRYINPTMLYGKHLGLKGKLEHLLAQGDEKATALFKIMQSLMDEVSHHKSIIAKAVYRFYPAYQIDDSIVLCQSDEKTPLATFNFPRQQSHQGLCLSDFVMPKNKQGLAQDNVCLFVTSCGQGIRTQALMYKNQGEYLKSHALQALAIESAEAFAELLHEKIRDMWGFKDPDTLSMQERFSKRYRGVRVSFGYPACPRLEDQEILFRLLEPQKHIGVELTDGFMMDPEASVSAMVFHHPQGRYFNLRDDDMKEFTRLLSKPSQAR